MATVRWEKVCGRSLHPISFCILKMATGRRLNKGQDLTPKEAADALDIPLPVASYHVRSLQKRQLLVATRRDQVRGATRHYYTVPASLIDR